MAKPVAGRFQFDDCTALSVLCYSPRWLQTLPIGFRYGWRTLVSTLVFVSIACRNSARQQRYCRLTHATPYGLLRRHYALRDMETLFRLGLSSFVYRTTQKIRLTRLLLCRQRYFVGGCLVLSHKASRVRAMGSCGPSTRAKAMFFLQLTALKSRSLEQHRHCAPLLDCFLRMRLAHPLRSVCLTLTFRFCRTAVINCALWLARWLRLCF